MKKYLLIFLPILLLILSLQLIVVPNLFAQCYAKGNICYDGSDVIFYDDLVMGTATTSYNITSHDGGTIVLYDDGDDTSVTVGPVTDGTTTLGITGGVNTSGDITANQFNGSGAGLTNIPASGIADGDHGDFTYSSGTASLDPNVVDPNNMGYGDYGDFTISNNTAALDPNVIEASNMAYGDYGDFTITNNTASLDTDIVSDNEIDYSNVTLDDFDYQTAWRLFYSDGSGDVTELGFGASGEYLKSQGTTSAPTWDTAGGSASCIEASDGDPNDALCADASGNLTSANVAIDFGGAASFEIPNNNGDVTADAAGEIFYDEAEDQWVFYDSQGGELDGEEVADTAIKYFSARLDPGSHYDRDQDIFLITVGDNFPSGIIIDEWKTSCNTSSPDVEIDADLFYADDWATLGNLTIMDALDTSSGVSSEDTDSSINGGVAVANGKVIGVRINLDPEGTCTQWIIEVWGHGID